MPETTGDSAMDQESPIKSTVPDAGVIDDHYSICIEENYYLEELPYYLFEPEDLFVPEDLLFKSRQKLYRLKLQAEELTQQIERLKEDSVKLSTLLKDRNIDGVKSLTAFLLIDLRELETDLLLLEDEEARKTLNVEFQKIKSKVDTVQESLTLTTVTTPQQPPQIVIREPVIQRPQLKIKAVTLDTFNGNIREYGAWWEMFKIGVHDVKEFDEVMKFSHLKSTLRGEAKQAVEGLGKMGNNYEKALAELKRRFGDPAKLAAAFYEDIKTLPPNHEANGQRPTYDSIQKNLANLESIGSSIDQENLKSTILGKFSKDTLREALRHLNYSDSEAPFSQFSVPDIMSALQKAVSLEELVDMYYADGKDSGNSTRYPSKNRTYQNQSPVAALMNVNTSGAAHDYRAKNKKCKLCNETSHVTQECGNYRTKDKRQERLSQLNLCYVCLSDSHKAGACSSKDRPCVYCKRTGHSKFLCINFLKDKQQRYEQSKQNKDPAVTRSNSGSTPPGKGNGTFLETFTCYVRINNQYTKVRGIIDSGSELSYVEDSLVQKLKLSKNVKNRKQVQRSTFGKKAPTYVSSGEITLTLANLDKSVEKTLRYNTTPVITGPIKTAPPSELVQKILPKDLEYADSYIFSDCREPIQLLIGCNFAQYEFLLEDIIKLPTPRITLKKSIFGWIPSGELLGNVFNEPIPTTTLFCSSQEEENALDPQKTLDNDSLDKLWSLEAIGIRSSDLEVTNDLVLEKFRKTVRFEDSRYIVRWPWKQEHPKIPTNFKMCMARLTNLINTLKSKNMLKKYDSAIKEQLLLGTIEPAPKKPQNATVVHYLPHRGVEKNEKLRIVYDASAKTEKNPCLNDLMHSGPVLTEDLVGLDINFRLHQYALIADIEKAFHQMRLNEVDRDSVRFLWVKDLSKPINMENLLFLRFTSVIFGATASPFLLNIVIKELLSLPPSNPYILAARRKFYVDNFVMSLKKLTDAVETHDSLVERFRLASFNLRDWKTNDPEVREALSLQPASSEEIVSVLGINWNTGKDTLSIKFEQREAPKYPTKRFVLSFLASIFDPLGLVSPSLLPLKLFMQECWKMKLTWNDILPPDLTARFLKLFQEAQQISLIEIPRRLFNFPICGTVTLNIFCDASKDAYACVAYLTCNNPETRQSDSTLIFSKIRVAPIKMHPSIPNLELLAVLIGKRSANFLIDKIDLKIDRTIIWTDATTVLQWLNSSDILPKFVQNRVTEIRSSPNLIFRHVPGKANPADIASRGMTASNLSSSESWWKGPSWLPHEKLWPKPPENTETFATPTVALAVNTPAYTGYLSDKAEKNRSTWDAYVKAVRGFMFLFGKNFRNLPKFQTYRLAEQNLVLEIQRKYLSHEIAMLKKGLQPDPRLNLFLDKKTGLIRCKGRIQHPKFPEYTINPILLPKECFLTKLYILKVHSDNMHMGVNYTLAKIRERYWIPKGRLTVKYVLHRCTACRRWEGGSYELPPIPPLPNVRLEMDAPFVFSGVDYLGPMYILDDNKEVVKAWVVIFVCLVTRAIHLEVARDLSANKFILALIRFGSRRGCPKFMISDNAANFKFVQPLVGTEVHDANIQDPAVTKFLDNNDIKWHFIPQYAPWHGGAYERLVAIVKSCLKKCYRIDYLDYDEFETALTKIEKIVNDRPLTYISEEISAPLTPSNFLLPARKANVLVDIEINENKLDSKREPLVSSLKNTYSVLELFWSLFETQYLLSLRERHTVKHPTEVNSLPYLPRKGEVVLVKEPSAPRAHWKLGVVMKLNKGDRTAELRCNNKTTLRAINQLYPLEIPDETKTDHRKTVENSSKAPQKRYLNMPKGTTGQKKARFS